jgi:ABC-type multidrug transport system ATPase subunit
MHLRVCRCKRLKSRPARDEFPQLSASVNNSSAATAPVLLTGVTKHFGRFAALRAVTAEFASARLYTVLGDNGAGKSTLLRIIAGLIPPTRGTVTVLGSTDPRLVSGRIGLMEHAPLLYDELDAMENLRYFAGLYGIHDHAVCEQAIQTVGLDPALKRRVGQYSQGMRQRLSLARATLNDPELFLLDEPFSNVDITSAREMVHLLGRMRDCGRTILVVTHQPSLLEGTADEFIEMAAGRIVRRTSGLISTAASVPRVTADEQDAEIRLGH